MISSAWPAPAKLNLFLHITGRREDGYHLLQTVFQFLDYGDTLTFHPTQDGRIRLLTPLPGVPHETDLTVRAATLLKEKTHCPLGAELKIDKHLPMGGGLGGGSSDAATTLVALNHLWGTGLSVDELVELGLQLGADVPVFVRGQAAWAEGVGEKLTPVTLPEPWFLVLVPPVHVDTGKIFSDPELTRDCHSITIRDFLGGHGENVCQPLVEKRYPAVAEAIDWLGKYANAVMTGTGACVFAAFETQTEARETLEKRPAGWQGFIAKGLNRSPLLKRLAVEKQ